MALMDKVSEFAKNASDKTVVMFETAKLNSKISAQEKTIAALTMRLGEYFLAQCDAGLVVMEGEAAEICAEISACRETIAELQEEISAVRAARDFDESETGVKFCPSCGEALTTEAKFCPRCGAKRA